MESGNRQKNKDMLERSPMLFLLSADIIKGNETDVKTNRYSTNQHNRVARGIIAEFSWYSQRPVTIKCYKFDDGVSPEQDLPFLYQRPAVLFRYHLGPHHPRQPWLRSHHHRPNGQKQNNIIDDLNSSRLRITERAPLLPFDYEEESKNNKIGLLRQQSDSLKKKIN